MLKGRSFTKETDLTPAEWLTVLDLAAQLKAGRRERREVERLVGKKAALLFEETSTRTSRSLDITMAEQGGYATRLDTARSQFVHKESAVDTIRALGRWYGGIEYRSFARETLEIMGRHAGIPVYNGLTDSWHPTQMLADQLTMLEHSGKPLKETSWVFVGDVRNNMGNSNLISAATVGADIRLVAPKQLQTTDEVRAQAKAVTAGTGARITIADDIAEGVAGVDFLHTNVWLSFGEPKELWAERIELLKPYQANAEMMTATGNSRAKFTYCLPASHDRNTTVGEEIYQATGLDALEVTGEVSESEASIVFDQAENRMHTIKTILVTTLAD